MLYIRDEIKKLSQRYTNRMEKYPNILVANVMTKRQNITQIKKEITSRSMHLTGL